LIRIGENPQGKEGINKFLTRTEHEGLRGKILALNKDKTKAIILCLNTSFDCDCQWGRLYLIEEVDSEQYPLVVGVVDSIPPQEGWETV